MSRRLLQESRTLDLLCQMVSILALRTLSRAIWATIGEVAYFGYFVLRHEPNLNRELPLRVVIRAAPPIAHVALLIHYRIMSLIYPYLKTSRAKVHLENLRARLEELGKEPCEFIREDDVQNQVHIVRMKVRPIPDDIPLIAGDLFYCLRAPLDQLVWCLAKINATPGYPEHTQFPILEQRNDPGFKRHTRGVPPEAEDNRSSSTVQYARPHGY